MTRKSMQDDLAYPPRGMNADRAAAYVGVSRTKFTEMVDRGEMPRPVIFDGEIARWDRYDLDAAFETAKERAVRASRPGGRSFDDLMGGAPKGGNSGGKGKPALSQ